jgi:hypothetical protein
MKWFQVDSDTPNDPKIRALVRELGAAGMGGLFFLWCHIADHGIRKPGWSLDSFGRPMPVEELIDASKLSEPEFSKLAVICTSSGHWLKRPWERRKVIAIPAMTRRADTYTKRRVRTHVEQSPTNVEESSSTTQDNTGHSKKNPLTPFQGGRLKRAELKAAKELRATVYGGCPHEPRCTKYQSCVEAIALSRRAS